MSEEIKETVTDDVTDEIILYSVVLDKLNRFTGIYSDLGDIDGSVKVKSLPNETDKTKMRFYQLVDPSLDYPWLFLEDEYKDFIEETTKIALEKKKNKLVSRSKNNLKNYLSTHNIYLLGVIEILKRSIVLHLKNR